MTSRRQTSNTPALIDFMALPRKDFWELVADEGADAEANAVALWEKAVHTRLTQEEAVACLNALFIYSHARIKEYSGPLANVYPTKQYTPNRLGKRNTLWWVDHFTAGISRWSTLNWFSAAKRKKKSGKVGYAGASTHFVQGYHDLPFYIIPLMHGAWHEPNRNKDSYSIEYVNAGAVHIEQDAGGIDRWHYWARALPPKLVNDLPPVKLDTPYKGVKTMQPFTVEQFVNSIVLKRIVQQATQKMAPERMSQHSDWRRGKTDMGPLWPYEEINQAAFGTIPADEYGFIEEDEYEDYKEGLGATWDEVDGWRDETEALNNPEYGAHTFTHDDDEDEEDIASEMMSITEVQKFLTKKFYYPVTVDGKMGPNTRKFVKEFQRIWNSKNPNHLLKEDGIPGPRTCSAMRRR